MNKQNNRVKLYNIVAELCSFVVKTCSEDFFVKYSCVSTKERRRISTVISNKIALFANDRGDFTDEDLTNNFFKSFRSLVNKLKREKDFFCIIRLLQLTDKKLRNLLHSEIAKYQTEETSRVINSNREECGVGLLPRCHCCWERKRRLSHYYNRLDNFLSNLLLIQNDILDNIIDRHIFLKAELFDKFRKSGELKIAVSPFGLFPHFNVSIYDENRIRYFTVESDNKYFAEDNELAWNKILLAAENKTDIVVFPELMGNPEMATFISKKIKEQSADFIRKLPSLIILPSYWTKEHRNVATVLDRFGDEICLQCKQYPFRYELNGEGLLEAINSNMVVNILHFQGIGRIAILICKDFLTSKYVSQLMRCFKLTLIIAPSYSTGSYDFKQSIDICAHDDCNVIWINTCAAMQKGKEANFKSIGYVRKRISRYDDESQRLREMKICSSAFEGNCNRNCLYFDVMKSV